MAAVLACGPEARLSHRSAAELWGILPLRQAAIDVAVPEGVIRRRPGIRVHRQVGMTPESRRVLDGIPVADPISVLVDLASSLPDKELEAAVNEVDRRGLADPEEVRSALDSHPRRTGIGRLRRLLDRETFLLTDSELERRFLRIVRKAALPLPETQVDLNGHRVDFYWRGVGLVVETDGLRYHRTPLRQAADQRRDHAHVSAGHTTLRFTHSQVRYQPDYVQRILTAGFERLRTHSSIDFGGQSPHNLSGSAGRAVRARGGAHRGGGDGGPG